MLKSYLNRSTHYKFIVLALLVFVFSSLAMAIIILLFYAAFIFLFRKKTEKYNQDPQISKKGLFYSPIDGRIINVFKNVEVENMDGPCHCVRITNYWGQNSGLFLPMSSEVHERWDVEKPTFLPRFGFFKINGLDDISGKMIKFQNKLSEYFALKFVQCPLGLGAEIWALPGDRGIRQANLGLFKLGGTVLLFIPQNYEIIVKQGEWIKSAETIIAKRENTAGV